VLPHQSCQPGEHARTRPAAHTSTHAGRRRGTGLGWRRSRRRAERTTAAGCRRRGCPPRSGPDSTADRLHCAHDMRDPTVQDSPTSHCVDLVKGRTTPRDGTPERRAIELPHRPRRGLMMLNRLQPARRSNHPRIIRSHRAKTPHATPARPRHTRHRLHRSNNYPQSSHRNPPCTANPEALLSRDPCNTPSACQATNDRHRAVLVSALLNLSQRDPASPGFSMSSAAFARCALLALRLGRPVALAEIGMQPHDAGSSARVRCGGAGDWGTMGSLFVPLTG
jgi:hypothetical protein